MLQPALGIHVAHRQHGLRDRRVEHGSRAPWPCARLFCSSTNRVRWATGWASKGANRADAPHVWQSLAGREGCRARWRGATFFAWQAQALEHTAHRGHTDTHAPLTGDTGTQLLQGDIGVVVHQLPDQWVGGVQGGSLAARMRFGRDVPRCAVTAYELLDKRDIDAKEVREGALGAEPALTRPKNLVP
jgi:hypothetical protein